MFEASQYDSYGYLFNKPTFISLDPTATPAQHRDQGHAHRRQRRRGAGRPGLHPARTPPSAARTTRPATGQLLSNVGTVIGLEKGPVRRPVLPVLRAASARTRTRAPSRRPSAALAPPDCRRSRTSACAPSTSSTRRMSTITGVPITNAGVAATYAAGEAAAAGGAEHRRVPRFAPDRHRAARHRVLQRHGRRRHAAQRSSAGSIRRFDLRRGGRDQLIDPLLDKASAASIAARSRPRSRRSSARSRRSATCDQLMRADRHAAHGSNAEARTASSPRRPAAPRSAAPRRRAVRDSREYRS